ncbi:hypothetical protein GGR53DRAFT_480164 [Hypoxylon sp. FL1150]|nr:hypothetical protein GGR53DRAFT_480164 [Hypoxylon sp. FL1150]
MSSPKSTSTLTGMAFSIRSMPSPRSTPSPWNNTSPETSHTVPAAVQSDTERFSVEDLSDEELICSYFDLDEACGECEDSDVLVEEIRGFEPIQKRKDKGNRLGLEKDTHEENFSGGCCGYVFPWSSQTMMGTLPPRALKAYTMDIHQTLGRKRKPTVEETETVKKIKKENPFPSAAADITWNKLYREIWVPKK